MYFHRGRLSLAARPWSPALQIELAKVKPKEGDDKPKPDDKAKEEKPKDDKAADAKKDAEKKKAEDDKRNEEDRAFLKWVDASAPELFVPWKEFKHPDFAGKKAEIGGFAPFARSNPPEKLLADLADKHGKFLTALAGRLPRVGLRKSVVKPLGESVYDVTLQIENTGYLPTSLSQGGLTREVHQTRVVLKVDAKTILSGAKTTMLGPIEGSGGMKEVRYIVHAKERNKLEVEIISMLGGTVQASVDLKEEK